jgi:hypothetical protein
MHKSATKCNKTLGKWCKNKHGASKIIDTLETYQKSSVAKLLKDAIGTHALPHLETAGMKIHSPELSLARLAVDL